MELSAPGAAACGGVARAFAGVGSGERAHGGAALASEGARGAACGDADLEALLLSCPDAPLLDFWTEARGGGGAEFGAPVFGLAPPQPLPPSQRCLNSAHAPGCARCGAVARAVRQLR